MKNESLNNDSRIITFRFSQKDLNEINKLCVYLTNTNKKPVDRTKAVKWAIELANSMNSIK